MAKRLGSILALGAALAALSACGQKETQVDQVEGAPVDIHASCVDPMSDPLVLAARQRMDDALRVELRQGAVDAAKEADKALAAGDFRLVASIGEGGVSTEDFGAECRVGDRLDQRMTRVIAYHDTDDKLEGYAPAGALSKFGHAYNEAMLDDPRYPYRDVCRSVKTAPVEEPTPGAELPHRYGFSYFARTSGALSAAQAARRGDLGALSQAVARDPKSLDRPDLFGLTPLAWAVAYRERDAAEWLLDHKASPAGPGCHTILDHISPMQVARAIHWRAMVTRMRPLVSVEDFNDLREAPRVSDADISDFNHGLTELNEKYRKVFNKRYLTRHHLIISLDDTGKQLSCRFEPATSQPGYDAGMCELGADVLHWRPARSAYGTAIPEDASLLVGVRGE
ncbi:ankyrin repeat domain-containing protein [Novosphingobium sp. 9]|uniref:ankyrin repeat domain-containing protein n=1 Tax=Novosphingobium sp. 9 TaxID=2025349 RepID=UPI0021B50ECD|nr:ankyrin repeat domain-containing protein [Novosphingobium sp. 9]